MGGGRRRRNALAVGSVLAGILLAGGPCAFALNPALDVSQYAHTAWRIREGFSKGTIFALAQTPDGYLWLATEFGLLRFDGVRNVPWQPPPDQHLPSNKIWSLVAARDGTLWIGTSKGLASWKGGKLTQYAELAGMEIFGLLEDHEGALWAGGWELPAGKLCTIQRGSVGCYGEDGLLGRGVSGSDEDRKGNLWMGVAAGLWRWKPGPPQFYPLAFESNVIQCMAEGDDGALLIGTRGGIKRLVDGKIEAHPLPGPVPEFQAHRLLRDRDGGLWIGTSDKGVVHVHEGRTDVFARHEGLSGDDVSAFLEDREGNIWVSTRDGLDRFRDVAVPTFSVGQGLSNARVTSVLSARDGSVWLGTYDGLNRWNHGHVTIYRDRGDRPPVPATPRGAVRELTRSGLPDQRLGSLFQDDGGRIWMSTLRGAGYLENDRYVSVSGVPAGQMYSITGDAAGNVWIANQEHGLFHLLGGSVVEQIPWTRLGHKDASMA